MIHIFANTIIIVLLLLASVWARRKNLGGIFALAGAVVGLLGWLFNHRPEMYAALFPFADTLFYANWYAFGAALFLPASGSLGRTRPQKIRIQILAVLLFGVALLPFRVFFLPLAKSLGTSTDENQICLQSDVDTCSAAAIVTLLARFDVTLTEEEAIRLALTRQGRGTNILGVYRALKIKTADRKDLRVTVDRMTFDDLLTFNQPAIITVGVPKKPVTQQQHDLIEKYNWDPGVVHQVVFLGRSPDDPNRVLIGEPAFGLERWPVESLRVLFRGLCVRIVRAG